jgi:menaquinone-dependent protoporphyrinogen oxidase
MTANENTSPPTLLVAVASRHGATREIGSFLATRLRESGFRVDVKDVTDDLAVGNYDAVILGSAVYYGRWLPSARDFAERHSATLSRRLVWLFSCGPLGDPALPSEPSADGERIQDDILARDLVVFAGRLEPAALKVRERAVVRVVGAAPGDFRDWDAIRVWADEIAGALFVLGGADRTTRSQPRGPLADRGIMREARNPRCGERPEWRHPSPETSSTPRRKEPSDEH